MHSLSRRRILQYLGLGAATIASAPLLASCAGPGTDEDTIRLGALYPVTGTNALLGQESWRGVQIATDLRNDAGGVAGKRVEMIFADVPDVNTAASEARRLVFNQNVKLGLGAYSSSLALAISEVFQRTGNAYVELGAVSEAVTGRGYNHVFRFNPTAKDMIERHMDFIENFLTKSLGKSIDDLNVVMLYEDSSYGQSINALAADAAKKINLQNFSGESYSATSTDLSSTVLRLEKKNPDVVLAVSYASDAVLLARQIRDHGVKLGAFVGTGGGHSLKSFYDAVGEMSNGVFDVDFTQVNINKDYTPGLDEFVEKYRAKFKSNPASGHSLANFTATNLIFDVLERTNGNDDPDTFGKAAREMEQEYGTTTAGWGYKLNENNQNERGEMYVMQWNDGDLETVWPPEAAVRKPQMITPFGL